MKTYKKILLGKVDNEKIYLSAPSWNCDWYWGFGYIGNKNCHYHIDGLSKDCNLHDGLINHFGDSLRVQPSTLWTLVELFKTFYTLKETAEVLGHGGVNLIPNPCKDLILNTKEVERINKVVLPSIFDEIYKILENYTSFERDINKIKSLLIEGNTHSIVDLMLTNYISPDDLKNYINRHDFQVVHSLYWDTYHAIKKAKVNK